MSAYDSSDKGRARHRRYNVSDKGRARYERYADAVASDIMRRVPRELAHRHQQALARHAARAERVPEGDSSIPGALFEEVWKKYAPPE
jgi:hypothetical protein